MNPTSKNAGPDILISPFRNELTNRVLYLTLLVAGSLAFVFTLARYAWVGGNPLNRLPYALFMSVVPGLCAFLLFKLTRLSLSWRRAATVYLILFLLISVVQSFARMIPVN
jgi:hypothetical protein